ncbi:hypothetical protein C3L33_05908, partial [Rhododendron williamsianum]
MEHWVKKKKKKKEEEAENQFHRLPDDVVVNIFDKVSDVQSLCRCLVVSKRFSSLVPLVQTLSFKTSAWDYLSFFRDESEDALVNGSLGELSKLTTFAIIVYAIKELTLRAYLESVDAMDNKRRNQMGYANEVAKAERLFLVVARVKGCHRCANSDWNKGDEFWVKIEMIKLGYYVDGDWNKGDEFWVKIEMIKLGYYVDGYEAKKLVTSLGKPAAEVHVWNTCPMAA